jgi:hypothetical protein
MIGTTTIRIAVAIAVSFLSFAANAELSHPSSVTYTASDGTRRMHVFASTSGVSMVENYFDGTSWHWITHNAPDGFYGFRQPHAISFEQNGSQRIYVFAIGQNSFRARYFDGSEWHWTKVPGGFFLSDYVPSAVTYTGPGGTRHIQVFAVNDTTSFTNNLNVTSWNGRSWDVEHIRPAASVRFYEPLVAVTYSVDGEPRVQLFCLAKKSMVPTSTVWSALWNGANWSWTDLGIQGFTPKSAVAFVDGDGTQVIRMYGSHASGLYSYTWNGMFWVGSSLGKPSESGPGSIDAMTFIDFDGVRKHFVAGVFGGRMYWKVHDGAAWSSYTTHSANFPASEVSAVGYPTPFLGAQFIQIFTTSGDKLMRSRWNGVQWQLYDNGSP